MLSCDTILPLYFIKIANTVRMTKIIFFISKEKQFRCVVRSHKLKCICCNLIFRYWNYSNFCGSLWFRQAHLSLMFLCNLLNNTKNSATLLQKKKEAERWERKRILYIPFGTNCARCSRNYSYAIRRWTFINRSRSIQFFFYIMKPHKTVITTYILLYNI